MAQNSKPRSASSASNKRNKYQQQRAHSRSSRQVATGTPRVLSAGQDTAPAGGTRGNRQRTSSTGRSSSGSHRTQGQRSTRSSRQSARSTRPSQAAPARTSQKKRGGLGFKIGIIAAVLVVLVGGFIALYFSSLFALTNIEVTGNEKLQSEYVVELAAVPDDSTFLRVDTGSIEARILAEPWIQSVEIERIFPSTLVLHITEQPIAAVVDIVPETATAQAQRWVIAYDGTWIAQVDDSMVASPESSQDEATPEEGAEGTENANTTEDQTAEGAGAEDAAEAPDTAEEGSEGSPNADTAPGEQDTANTDEGDSSSADEGLDTSAGQEANANGSSSASSSNAEGGSAAQSAKISAEELVEIPKIKDVSAAVRPVAGAIETDEGVLNALALLEGFSDEMRSMVASISAPDAVKTTLTLYNNVGVAFGAAEDIEAKEQAIATLLAEHEGTITYINVRVADRATYRATDYTTE